MEPRCKRIVNVMLPAVRASVAETLHSDYGYNQKEIADSLGIVQVAVSKYLHGKHSAEIKKLKDYIVARGLNSEIVARISAREGREKIDEAIDGLCDRLVAEETA